MSHIKFDLQEKVEKILREKGIGVVLLTSTNSSDLWDADVDEELEPLRIHHESLGNERVELAPLFPKQSFKGKKGEDEVIHAVVTQILEKIDPDKQQVFLGKVEVKQIDDFFGWNSLVVAEVYFYPRLRLKYNSFSVSEK